MAFEMAWFDFIKSKCSPTEGYPRQPWILFFMFRCYEICIPVSVFQIPAVIGFQFFEGFRSRDFLYSKRISLRWPLLCVFCLQTSYIDKDFQKQLVNGQNHVTISRLAETVSAVTQAAPVSELTFESCFLKCEWNVALASHVLCHRSTGRGEVWTYVKRFTTEVLFLTQSQLPFRLLKLVVREFTDRLTVIFWGVSKRDLLSLIIFSINSLTNNA